MSLRNLCNYLKLFLIMLHLELNYSHLFCTALFTADLLVSKWGMPKSNYLHPKVGFISSSNQATEHARAEFRRRDAEKRGFFSLPSFLECGGTRPQICPLEWRRISFLLGGEKKARAAAPRRSSWLGCGQDGCATKGLPSTCELFHSAPQKSPDLLLSSYHMYKSAKS